MSEQHTLTERIAAAETDPAHRKHPTTGQFTPSAQTQAQALQQTIQAGHHITPADPPPPDDHTHGTI